MDDVRQGSTCQHSANKQQGRGKDTEQQTVASQVRVLWGATDSERVTQRKQTRSVVVDSGGPERPGM